MDKKPLYKQHIEKEFPNLSIHSIEHNEIGQNNDVLIVNRELVFRFPKYEAGIRELAEEVRILRFVRERVSLPIPEPVYCCFSADRVGHAFAGYRMIPGEPLWNPALQSIGDIRARQRLAVQLGTFLRELHSIPTNERQQFAQPRHGGISAWSDLYERIRGKLFPHMREEARRDVANHFERFLGEPKHAAIPHVLIHGDFGTSNIIWEPDKQSIAGIIDFGGFCLDDPAVDFAALAGSYGISFVRMTAEAYPNLEALLPRVDFYAGTFALQEALFGLENQDEEAFKSGIASYK